MLEPSGKAVLSLIPLMAGSNPVLLFLKEQAPINQTRFPDLSLEVTQCTIRSDMNTESLIKFFNSKLEQMASLRSLRDYRDPTFATWWNTIESTCERMGESYKQRATRIRFSPGMVVGGADNSARYAKAYSSGLDKAEALIKSIIEELETWGYGNEQTAEPNPTPAHDKVVLNLTISQQQVQQITQTINLSQYDPEVQAKVEELLDELKRESKDKPKIINIVKWLADKGSDALIAVLLAATHLT